MGGRGDSCAETKLSARGGRTKNARRWWSVYQILPQPLPLPLPLPLPQPLQLEHQVDFCCVLVCVGEWAGGFCYLSYSGAYLASTYQQASTPTRSNMQLTARSSRSTQNNNKKQQAQYKIQNKIKTYKVQYKIRENMGP